MKSPIYCDNRQILSHPDVRAAVASELTSAVRQHFVSCEVVAGVATGAIAHGALVADRLGKPFVYVRSAKKGHGLSNMIEGNLPQGSKVVVIEDLISTAKSSLEAVKALREAGADVLGMVAIFSYQLPQAEKALEENNCNFITLSNYTFLLQQAMISGILGADEVTLLSEWKKNPENFYNGKI